MEKLDLTTPNITDENVQKIAELFPNCVTESVNGETQVVDFDLLRQELSSNIVEGNKERYQLTWPGKAESLVTANTPINKTLRPVREESKDFDNTENLYIEGDNLEVLKLLQETYLGKIKMIYIDPPYNTGKDFVYKDNFTQDKAEYDEESGNIDDEGGRLVSNPDSNGRYHSDWLSMMYPRLKLARNLLKDDGVIFISIGVEEFDNLKKICDEVYGENNFVEIFSWVKTSTPPALSTKSRKTNEYIICYEKSRTNFKYKGEVLDGGDQPLLNRGNTTRELTFPKDKVLFKENIFSDGELLASAPDRVELINTIQILNGYSTSNIVLKGEFKWTQDFLDNEIAKGTTFIIKSDKLSIRFIRNEEGFKRPTNFIKDKYTTPIINKSENNVGTNEFGSSELKALMGEDLFDNPKPTTLLQYLSNFITENEDVILDFFSGSATTAHAVMQLNAEDGGKRKFIMAQIPEETDEKSEAYKAGYKTIAEIGKARIRRAGEKIKEDNADKEGIDDLDVGFRVLKVASSNIEDVHLSPDNTKQNDILNLFRNIKEGRTDEDLLFMVLLDWGIDLSVKIERREVAGKVVYFADDNFLAACFEKNIDEDFVKALVDNNPLKVVLQDNGFANDSVKINAEQIFKQADIEVKVI